MQRLSISKGHAFILVYSVTSRQSMEDLQPIFEQICQIKGDIQKIPIMLVGNKSDETQRELDASEGQALASKWKCSFMETSAKMNYNVQELFQELLNLEKRRTVSLQVDGKKSKQQKKKDKLQGKCSVMPRPAPQGRGGAWGRWAGRARAVGGASPPAPVARGDGLRAEDGSGWADHYTDKIKASRTGSKTAYVD
ncbi:GTP-binding protein Di-Ras3 [Grus japonensis]|uniref:GTP-binding protein Di-Ras3 n=1 Tax=Grus japonensis TaxID=30415 RepID=A0ABC9X6S6_GRUJA